MSIENKVELLWNCAFALKGDEQIHKMLKSYYINTARRLSKNTIQLPKEKIAFSQICSYCGNCWYEGRFRMKSMPRRLSTNTKTKKLIEKLEKSSITLNRKQRKRAKWLQKNISNYLEIECENCKRKSKIKLESANKKASKTRDNNSIKYKEQIANVENNRKTQQNNIGKKGAKTSQQKKVNCVERKLLQVEIKSAPRKRKTNITSAKVISKTQKQNNLLQLAALLKRNPHNDSKVKKSKLDSFLK